jgi:septum formation protein
VIDHAMIGRPKLVLASGSPRRLGLLNQVGIEPDSLMPSDVDELPVKGELPRALATRVARAKAETALAAVRRGEELRGSFIIAADTVVSVGRRIMPKAEMLDEAAQCLRLLSGRSHRVYTAVCVVTPKETFRQRLVQTRVRFKRLSREDLEGYLASGEWRGKAGAYAIQGLAGSFVVKIVGSYTNVVGLPLQETVALLAGEGYPVHFGWLSAG